jgi:hypothetical protein
VGNILPSVEPEITYDSDLDSESTENYYEDQEAMVEDSDSDTSNYLKDESFQKDLSRRSKEVLLYLIQNNAYETMEKL